MVNQQMGEFEWAAFLEPWRNILRQVVEFRDEDELVVGSLHETLQCEPVYFQYCDDLDDPSVDEAVLVFHQDWDEVVSRKVREALELIGLALRYDKRAWLWLRPDFARPTFVYNADDLDVVWAFTFHNDIGGDMIYEIKDAIAMFLRVDNTHLSAEYFTARKQLYELIGDSFDREYRLPVSFTLAPRDKLFDVDEWSQVIRDFVWAARAPAFIEESCFALASVTLLGWRLRINESVATLISELQLVQIPMPEVNLKLVDVPGIHSAKTMKSLCGLGAGNSSLVEVIGIHEAALRPFVEACSSLMEANAPSRLTLHGAFGRDQAERHAKW